MSNSGLINTEYVNTVIKERKADIHKGDCGRILLIAGSEGMAGAAVMCAKSALRSGAGLVKVSIPENLFPIVQISVPEAMCINRRLSKSDFEQYDAVAIGPGLGAGDENVEIIEALLEDYEKTVIMDADALNIVARKGIHDILKRSQAKIIITPHEGEARRLLGMVKYQPIPDRGKMADELSALTGAITVLKGSNTIVTGGNGNTYINTTGNPGMATGGAGDVLTGIITSLAGQGIPAMDAAKTGVFVHGLAGDMCCDAFGEYGMTALDIADMTALAIKKIIQKR